MEMLLYILGSKYMDNTHKFRSAMVRFDTTYNYVSCTEKEKSFDLPFEDVHRTKCVHFTVLTCFLPLPKPGHKLIFFHHICNSNYTTIGKSPPYQDPWLSLKRCSRILHSCSEKDYRTPELTPFVPVGCDSLSSVASLPDF